MDKRTVVVDLGWAIGRLQYGTNGKAEDLMIVSPADADTQRYAPAESVNVYGLSALLKLKELLAEVAP